MLYWTRRMFQCWSFDEGKFLMLSTAGPCCSSSRMCHSITSHGLPPCPLYSNCPGGGGDRDNDPMRGAPLRMRMLSPLLQGPDSRQQSNPEWNTPLDWTLGPSVWTSLCEGPFWASSWSWGTWPLTKVSPLGWWPFLSSILHSHHVLDLRDGKRNLNLLPPLRTRTRCLPLISSPLLFSSNSVCHPAVAS